MSGVTLRHTNITTSVQKKIYKTLLTVLLSLSYSVQLLTCWEWDPVVVHTTVLTAPIDAFKSEYWIPMSSKAVLCHCQDYVFLFCYYNLIYRWSALWLGSVSIILILLGLLHLLKTNWYIIVIFCGNLKSSHHGTLAKTTKYFWIFYSPILRGKTACNQNQMTEPRTLCWWPSTAVVIISYLISPQAKNVRNAKICANTASLFVNLWSLAWIWRKWNLTGSNKANQCLECLKIPASLYCAGRLLWQTWYVLF